MKTTIKLLVTCMVFALLAIGTEAQAEYVIVDKPGAKHTNFRGIDGNNIVGFSDMGVSKPGTGFIYDKSTGAWKDVYIEGTKITEAYGISGDYVVGSAQTNTSNYSFIYDGTNFSTLNYDGASTTRASSIDGDFVVGACIKADDSSLGFIYDKSKSGAEAWQILDAKIFDPIAANTWCADIDGENILGGYYDDEYNFHNFVYNKMDKSWKLINIPDAVTYLNGIDGGSYIGLIDTEDGSSNGIYDGTTWTALNVLDSYQTVLYGIDNGNVVGYYLDAVGEHGFIYTGGGSAVPEPATLLGFGLPMLMVGIGKLRGMRK